MTFIPMLSAVALVSWMAAASATPRQASGVAIIIADVGRPRLVCNSRRCWQASGTRFYRPYGYYRPYYDPPRTGTGPDPFGAHMF